MIEFIGPDVDYKLFIERKWMDFKSALLFVYRRQSYHNKPVNCFAVMPVPATEMLVKTKRCFCYTSCSPRATSLLGSDNIAAVPPHWHPGSQENYPSTNCFDPLMALQSWVSLRRHVLSDFNIVRRYRLNQC